MGLVGWLVIIAVGLIWEAIAIAKGDTEEWPTLSHVIYVHLPKWILAASLGWLVWHLLG